MSAGVVRTEARRIVVLASGSGSNFQALLDAVAAGELHADIAALVVDRAEAYALDRAATAGVPAIHLPRAPGEARGDYDIRLADAVATFDPFLIVLAGWMRLLSMSFLGRFPGRVVNLHPALPGEFPGTRAIERALHAARAGGPLRTGVMVHFVPDEGVDDGPVIAVEEVAITPDDTVETLAQRVHATEHALLVRAVQGLVSAAGRR